MTCLVNLLGTANVGGNFGPEAYFFRGMQTVKNNFRWMFYYLFQSVKTLPHVTISPTISLTLWQAERHFCHLRFTGAATILSFFRSILLAWILLAKLSVNVQ